MIIAVDAGNKQIKSEHFCFHSGLQESERMPQTAEKALMYQGKYYVPSSRRIKYLRTPAHYPDLYEKYEQYFYRKGELVSFLFGDKEYTVHFRSVTAYMAFLWVNSSHNLMKVSKVLVIDIGGFTSDYLLIRQGEPDLAFCDSLEKGVILMYNSMIAQIRQKYDVLLEESDIDAIILGQQIFCAKTIQDEVINLAEKYVFEFLGNFRELEIDFATTYTIFTGGGAQLTQAQEKLDAFYAKYDKNNETINNGISNIHTSIKNTQDQIAATRQKITDILTDMENKNVARQNEINQKFSDVENSIKATREQLTKVEKSVLETLSDMDKDMQENHKELVKILDGMESGIQKTLSENMAAIDEHFSSLQKSIDAFFA